MAAIAAAPALGDTPNAVTFAHGGYTVAMPLPEGYCEPQNDQQRTFAKNAALADADQATLVLLLPCNSDLEPSTLDYTEIKTPRRGMVAIQKIARADLIKLMREQYSLKSDQTAVDKEVGDSSARNASRIMGIPIDMSLSDMLPRGFDADCIYVGGIATISAAGRSLPVLAGECMTSVNDHFLTIVRYRTGGTMAALPALFAQTKAMLLSMKSTAGK